MRDVHNGFCGFVLALAGAAAVCAPALAQTPAPSGAQTPAAVQAAPAPSATAQAAPPATAQAAAPNARALEDAIKASSQGAQAFRDIRRTRLAIFSADPAGAKKALDEAAAALDKAKADAALFVKAESEMKSPKGAPQAAQPASDEKISWLPFDGGLTLGEDFVGAPEKAKAVREANEHFAKGRRDAALKALKLAQIDIYYTYAAAPLDKTLAGVKQAQADMGDGKYYEANAELKKVEDSVRFDSVDFRALPEKPAAAGAKAK